MDFLNSASIPFILDHFHEFNGEALALKREFQQSADSNLSAHMAKLGQDKGVENALSARLVTILERQAAEAPELTHDVSRQMFLDARYVMTALADEIFLGFEWQGRDYWRNHLLEKQLFGTQAAGDLFFQKLDDLLARNDFVYANLAKVYFMALALGFEGKYKGQDPEGRLPAYRKRLYAFIFKREPRFLDDSVKLFPEAYQAALGKGEPRMLPTTRRWTWTIAAAVLAAFILTHALWEGLTVDLSELARSIITRR